MKRREKMPEPAHSVLLLLGMAVVSWAAIGFAGAALWPRQSEVQPVGSPPLTAQDYRSPSVTVDRHRSDVTDPGKSRTTAKKAVRRKAKVMARRRGGPFFAARVFSASIY